MKEEITLNGVEIDFADYQTGVLNYITLLTNYYLLHYKTDKLNAGALRILEFFELCNTNNFSFAYVFTSSGENLYFKFRCNSREEYLRLFDFITEFFGKNIKMIQWQNNIIPTIVKVDRDFLKGDRDGRQA